MCNCKENIIKRNGIQRHAKDERLIVRLEPFIEGWQLIYITQGIYNHQLILEIVGHWAHCGRSTGMQIRLIGQTHLSV